MAALLTLGSNTCSLARSSSSAAAASIAWDWATARWSGLAGVLPTLLGYAAVLLALALGQGGPLRKADGTVDAGAASALAGVTAQLASNLCILPSIWGNLAAQGGSLARVVQVWAACEGQGKGSSRKGSSIYIVSKRRDNIL